jgi:hypothetical protein
MVVPDISMAQQKFSFAFREALWETYDGKCFHCTRSLLFRDMQVDHIIPEYLHYADSAEREPQLDRVGLPHDFDILGRGNMAPCCGECNGQKGGLVLIARSSAIALTRIAQKLPEFEKNLRAKKAVHEINKLAMMVMRSATKGKFDLEQFKAELEKLSPGRTDDGGPIQDLPPIQGPHKPTVKRYAPTDEPVRVPDDVPVRNTGVEKYGYWTGEDAIRIINALLSGTGEVEKFTHPTGEVRYAIRDGQFEHIFALYSDGTPQLRSVDTM